jgi:uncharacterized protein YggU (UPF0235/DUF167 family)
VTAFWEARPDGVRLLVRLTPRGGRDALEGPGTLADGRRVLKARVRAAPEKGAANAALEALLAAHFGVARSAVSVIAGQSGRLKTVAVQGDPDALARAARKVGTEG